MKQLFLTLLAYAFAATTYVAKSQCLQFVNYPADTVGWIEHSDHTDADHYAFYNNDTFVINTAQGGENNYIYNSIPVTLFGPETPFTASFDFRMDSSGECSDGLTFWFFTSGLSDLGDMDHEGCDQGFPDTTVGFALVMQTTVCENKINMREINSNNFYWCGGSSGDTTIGTDLSHQMWLVDSQWHHCVINYENGNITTSYDGGAVVMSGYANIYGTGHFGFMATNGGGHSRKCLKNIQICAGLGTPSVGTDSFGCYVNRLCNGPEITVQTHSYAASYYVKSYYGDGTSDSSAFSPGISGSGYAIISHTYQSPGHYTIKQVLYNGSVLKDSLQFSYENVFCATLPVKFYYDANGDCLKEDSEPYMAQPLLVEVDSNGVAIDNVSTTGGFYYNANGGPGDVYSFKILSLPGNMYASCPSTGILTDSLQAGIFVYGIQYGAISCSSGSGYDLAVSAVVPVTGIHDEWGDIYLTNSYCAPKDATLTVNFSPKYVFTGDADPAPSSTSSTTLTWNVSGLSADLSSPAHIHYQVDNPSSGTLTAGDTVNTFYTITPKSGDVDTINNFEIIIDTVRDGCDPNEMSVSPAGNIYAGTKLQYTINFTNTGNDTTFNIYVMDTISDNVDVQSLRLVTASNTMNIAMLKSGGHNIVKFDFPAINLLDSMDHPNQCSGAVIFNINTKAGLPNGTTIFNHAGVFFDYNPVVITNTVENIIGFPASASNVQPAAGNVYVYPNPANDVLTIKIDNASYNSFTISNTLGEVFVKRSPTASQMSVDVKSLPGGVYFITLKGESGVVVKKFVKN